MANAAAITVVDLVAATPTTDPTPNALDTGTDAVTLRANLGGNMDRVVLRVKNTGAQTTVVSIGAGDNPPAQRAGVGALSKTILAGVTWWIGPFESSRFVQSDGYLDVTVTPASGTIGAEITCFRLPRI